MTTSATRNPYTATASSSGKISLIFSISDKVGGLTEVLDIVKRNNFTMTRIESRPSKTKHFDYDFFVDFSNVRQEDLQKLMDDLKTHGIGVGEALTHSGSQDSSSKLVKELQYIPWFPRKISDLDEFSNKVLEYGEDLEADHPGFTDMEYRKRRIEITKLASDFKHGMSLPKVQYTEQEIATWRIVYTELKNLYKTNACKQHNYVLPLLEQNCGYGPDNIPQLEDVSRFLQECTGWRLRPVKGLLSPRDFLNGLAFRVFHSTQYIRHHSRPLYTPEPDVCHELLGHVPLYADPDFADFSQQIGLASLGASDEDIKKLATCYWFTVEFGLCKEESGVKAFGAGLLSSFGELKYCLGADETKPEYRPFDPYKTAVTDYPITTYQPIYFVAESFQNAKEKMIEFANSLERPFSVRYNPYTQSVEILDGKEKLTRFVKELQSELLCLQHAIEKLPVS